ncbi:MAG: Chromatin segregation and condensation protein Rec8/ScpA/Scc1 kleisin family [Candidatus Methanohalarchaeum thermophilum]|uniref:Chromatin segregation and condensation protein Rec8/ScpA/Scc1 kleisin family n=1 Tax=Methanohalarchaeum thermophilum TaxID=1903181 RepID=A0A1Q6DXC4_METT1|nr:MAG: Chromatin segregation and condensation protein Rec8/ScpA/Scc1 kleisin family [Candidatus Methanohalarchaeum thermophilum]
MAINEKNQDRKRDNKSILLDEIKEGKEEIEEEIKKENAQPLEIMLELVDEGKVDPWDLDIINVADKFLSKVERLEKEDLTVSADTLLFSSKFLKLKSEALLEEEEDEDEEERMEPPTWDPVVFNPERESPPKIEPPCRRESKRSATFVELVEELKSAIKTDERRKNRRKKEKERKKENQEEVKNLAHEEAIEERIEKLKENLKNLFREKNQVNFTQLIKHKTKSELIKKFIPLLFLANRKEIKIEQEDIFDEIKIKPR